MKNFPGSTWFMRLVLVTLFLALPAVSSGAIRAEKDEKIPDLKPPRGTVAEPSNVRNWWPWMAAAACFAGAAILLWPRRAKVAPSSETPYGRTVRLLRERDDLTPQGLGTLLREYATERFHVPGAALTFAELATLLGQRTGWTPELEAQFRKLADPIEIATFAPGDTVVEMPQLRNEALALLNKFENLRRTEVPVVS